VKNIIKKGVVAMWLLTRHSENDRILLIATAPVFKGINP